MTRKFGEPKRWSDGSFGLVSDSFRRRADKSTFMESWVATKLCRAGLYVLHHPMEINGLQNDNPDIEVSTEEEYLWGPGRDARVHKVEIKSVGRYFTSTDDYGNVPVFICSKSSFNRKFGDIDYNPNDWVIVSSKTGACLWVPPMTPVFFRENFDKSRNELFMAVECDPKYMCTLELFIEEVKGRA